MLNFFKHKVTTKFGVSQAILIDNEVQLTGRKVKILLDEFNIKQHFSLVEHPETNGQA